MIDGYSYRSGWLVVYVERVRGVLLRNVLSSLRSCGVFRNKTPRTRDPGDLYCVVWRRLSSRNLRPADLQFMLKTIGSSHKGELHGSTAKTGTYAG